MFMWVQCQRGLDWPAVIASSQTSRHAACISKSGQAANLVRQQLQASSVVMHVLVWVCSCSLVLSCRPEGDVTFPTGACVGRASPDSQGTGRGIWRDRYQGVRASCMLLALHNLNNQLQIAALQQMKENTHDELPDSPSGVNKAKAFKFIQAGCSCSVC